MGNYFDSQVIIEFKRLKSDYDDSNTFDFHFRKT